jgi:phosphoribosyl-AMP cyclohydrolase
LAAQATAARIAFGEPSMDKTELEQGGSFTPRFDAAGLVTAVVTDAADGAVLMLAHMNAEALSLTLETGTAHFWSRSRGKLWKKGETSGNILEVVEMRTDCDQDAVWLRVRATGDEVACHTGRRSCFYRRVEPREGTARLVDDTIKTHFHAATADDISD